MPCYSQNNHPATKLAEVNRVVTVVDSSTFGTDWMTWDSAGDRDNWTEEGDDCAGQRKVPELLAEQVEVKDTGTVVTYSIIRVPSDNIKFELPYTCVNVLLDGASVGFFHVLQNCALEDVRIGMRVKAKWVDDSELAPNVASIAYFEPLDEPDVPYEKLRENT